MEPYYARLQYDGGSQVSVDGSRYEALYVEKESDRVTIGGTGSPPPRVADWLWVPGDNGWDPIQLGLFVNRDMYLAVGQVAEWDQTWLLR